MEKQLLIRPEIKATTVKAALVAGFVCGFSASASAEATLSIYGGANFSPHSRVKTTGTGAPDTNNLVAWDGASFKMPPYYGVRATWWLDQMPEVGLAIDFTHSKVTASPLPAGFTKLEFTDGINFLTANALYRYDMGNGFTPYAGVGIGVSIPHVEVEGPAVNNTSTLEYQATGIAAQGLVGVDYKLDENWSVFGEYKMTYGVVDADLNGGGSLSTDIISNQVIFGVTYKFN